MKLYFVLFYFFIFSILKAQLSFSIKQAIDEGLKNDLNLRNLKLDIEKTKQVNKQILATGLPQINASGNFIYNYVIPTALFPDFANPSAGLIPVQFSQSYNLTGQIEATQLLFEPTSFIAVVNRKILVEVSTKNVQRSELELKESISKAYYSVLISKKRVELLESTIKSLSKAKSNTEQLYLKGFVEKIDLDRITLNLKTLQSQKNKVVQLINLSEDLLKFQMGIDLNQTIILTDIIKEDDIKNIELFLLEEIKAENSLDFDLLSISTKLKEIELRKEKISFLPTLVAFINYGYNGPSNNLDNITFFKQGSGGLSFKMPIFSSFLRTAKIDEAKIELNKAKNTLDLLKKQYELKNKSLKINLKNALESYKLDKENIELAQKLYLQSQKKYEIGVGSSIEILDAQKELTEAQTNFSNSLYEIIVNKIEYLKYLNKL